ncbi:MAG: ABC transporter ATP-binding protein [Alphaproteobacteria bacterium]
MSLLAVENLRGGYGGVDILDGATVRIGLGEAVIFIGPNGAGKSTLMKAVFGLARIRAGRVLFDGDDITNRPPDEIVRRGLCYVPQEHNIFASLTVRENLEIGAFIRSDDIRPDIERVFAIFPPLAAKASRAAETLSGGERQMVAIARALMLRPKLLLLDEPTAGLSPLYVDLIFETLKTIHGQGLALGIVEHNAKKALAFADRGCVLIMGQVRHQGPAQTLLDDPDVVGAFLGG